MASGPLDLPALTVDRKGFYAGRAMEIVDVDQIPKGSVQCLVDELGDILGSEDGHTWLRIVPIPANHYAENRVVDVAQTIDQCSSRSAATRSL